MSVVYYCASCNRMVSNITTARCTKCGNKYISLGVDSAKWKSLSLEQRRAILNRCISVKTENTPTPSVAGKAFYRDEDEYKNKAIASLTLGIVSLLTWVIPIIGFPTTIIGLILGIKSIKSKNYGVIAVIGTILSSICLLLTIYSAIVGAIAGAIAGAYLDYIYNNL